MGSTLPTLFINTSKNTTYNVLVVDFYNLVTTLYPATLLSWSLHGGERGLQLNNQSTNKTSLFYTNKGAERRTTTRTTQLRQLIVTN